MTELVVHAVAVATDVTFVENGQPRHMMEEGLTNTYAAKAHYPLVKFLMYSE